MAITRKFLDWSRPALPAVVDHLVAHHSVLGFTDLSDLVVVFPGRQAGRRFLEILVDRTAGRNAPPQIVTVGQLPELLYEPQRPFANNLVQQLAWAEALRSLPRDAAAQVIPNLPDDADADQWRTLGSLLWRLHTELAAEGRHFGDVAAAGRDVAGFDEHARWDVFRRVQQAYLDLLDELELWDQQTARLVAIEQRECRTRRDILLVGTSDMNRTLRQMLDQVSERVTAYVHAPQKLSRRFDIYGCLVPEAWKKALIDLNNEQVRVVDRPVDQADAVARTIAAYDAKYRADEITIGIASDGLVPSVRRLLTQCGVNTRWVEQHSVSQTPPYRLCAAVAELLESDRSDHFAALVRHPDVSAWLALQGAETGWLAELDDYLADHLQRQLGEWLGPEHATAGLQQIVAAIAALLLPLRGNPRPLSEWTVPWTELLLNVYGSVEFDSADRDQRIALEACKQLQQALVTHTAVPEKLSPVVTASQALQLTLDELQSEVIPPLPDDAAIELQGWLELPLDDAPALIVTGVNEGAIPTAVNADLFLPNALRRQLGLTDNARRYARDAYALSAILHARERVTLIVGRRSEEGDPLIPSRLLFAAEHEEIAARVRRFFGDREIPAEPPPLAGTLTAAASGTSAFPIPRPQPLEIPISRLKVTALRDYIASPYRFYLRHVLGLQAVDDAPEELTGPAFGSLLHEVLKWFGNSAVSRSTDPAAIRKYLLRSLDQCVARQYGSERLMAVDVQIELARRRLQTFAEWQAAWAAEGWTIRHTEEPAAGGGVLWPTDDGRSVHFIGRIDRIDYHAADDCWAIFDYKTGDAGDTPDKVHRPSGEWTDLQLPLYRHLAVPLGVTGDVRLGFIVLPRDTNAVGALFAEWSAEELAEADLTATAAAIGILDQVFWEELDTPSGQLPEFDPICQEGVFDRDAIV